MIVLNNNKELVRVENWEEIVARPGFTTDLNPKNHELAAILGRYAFAERIRCGLSDCHTPHIRGYIVSTKDGRKTNIGKDCGKNYFGVDFETLTRQFDQDITDKENRERLWSLRFRLEELKSQIDTIRSQPRGADWFYRTSRSLVEPGRTLPNEVVRRVTYMIKTRQNVVFTEREATEVEVEQMEAARGRKLPRPQYVEVPLGLIDGMEALFLENDLRQLLVIDLQQEIQAFEVLTVDELSSRSLTHWNKWAGSIEPKLERASLAVDAGRRLLTAENLSVLLQVTSDKGQVERTKKFLKSLADE